VVPLVWSIAVCLQVLQSLTDDFVDHLQQGVHRSALGVFEDARIRHGHGVRVLLLGVGPGENGLV
jgi:hypothetical protein